MTFGGFHGNWPVQRGTKTPGRKVARPSAKPPQPAAPAKARPSVTRKTAPAAAPQPPRPPPSVRIRPKPKVVPPRVPTPASLKAAPTPQKAPSEAKAWKRPELIIPRIPKVSFDGRQGIAIVGQFDPWKWGQHPDEAYLADAIEVMGTRVYRVGPDDWGNPLMQAEWALFTGPSARKLDAWSGTHKTLVWTLDWLPDHPERQYIIDAGARANLFVTSDRYDWAGRAGIGHHFYLPAGCESLAITLSPKPMRSVAFLGSIYNERRRRIAELVRSFGGEVLDQPSSWIYGARLARYCQDTKIIVGDNIVNNCPGYWSSRNYVIPGVGGFLLTPLVPELDEQFDLGKTIAVYSSLSELKSTIQYYLSHDEERERIRRKSFEFVRGAHNWGERAVKLLDRLGVRSR